MNNIEMVAKQFRMDGNFVAGEPYGTGHINDTYVLTFDQDGKEVKYILLCLLLPHQSSPLKVYL